MGDEGHIHDDCPHCGHQLSELRRQVSDIHGFIMGGSEPSRGAVVRLDRLEQNEKRREWVLRAVGGAALAALVTTVIGWFKHGGPNS